MNRITLFLLLIFGGVMFLNAQTLEKTDSILKGPYLGQEPPGNHSAIFAPGFVSTEARELNAVFCCGGNEFYFSRRGIPGKPSALMATKRINDTWTDPKQLEFSGNYSDIDLFITADGGSMIFCSQRPPKKGGEEKTDHDFWISKREENGWSDPVPFATEAMSDFEDFYPVVTRNGNLYFNSQRGNERDNNIYCSQYIDGEYTMAAKLPEPINSDDWEFDAFVAQDEKMIIFSSNRPGGYGGADIYISFRKPDGSWQEPKNLGPEVNSENYEYGASISPDGKYLFYTSTKNGNENISWIAAEILFMETVSPAPVQVVKTNGEIFMDYFMKNWDDVHDVIMRFHNDDPDLKGVVSINMTWRQGDLADAGILENTTGNSDYGSALIAAMKNWHIPEIVDGWSSAIPIRTSIKGSDDPDFDEYGILTGRIVDRYGNPVSQARVVLQSAHGKMYRADTAYTNREGIFIQTLIPPATWHILYSKPGYVPSTVKNIKIMKAQHVKQDIILTSDGKKDR